MLLKNHFMYLLASLLSATVFAHVCANCGYKSEHADNLNLNMKMHFVQF